MQNPDTPVDVHPDGIAHNYPEPPTEPPVLDADGRQFVSSMTDRELLEESVRNTRDIVDGINAIVTQVGEAMSSPMLKGVMGMFGRRG